MRLSWSAFVAASSFVDAFKVLRALRRSFSLNRTVVRLSAGITFPPQRRITLAVATFNVIGQIMGHSLAEPPSTPEQTAEPSRQLPSCTPSLYHVSGIPETWKWSHNAVYRRAWKEICDLYQWWRKRRPARRSPLDNKKIAEPPLRFEKIAGTKFYR